MTRKRGQRSHRPHKRLQRRSTPAPRPNPQPWFLDLATPRIKQARERDLREKLRTVRRLFSGFEASDGYDGRYPRNWSMQRRRSVERFAYQANTLLSTPGLLIKPRSQRERDALEKHTGQLHPRQIRFVVHVPAPQKMRVRFVRDRARVPFMGAAALRLKTLRVETVEKVTGGEMYTRDYLFREILGYQPVVWEDFIYALIRLLPYLPDRTPSGEEATYTLLSQPHGPISSPVLKSLLLEEMQRWAEEYADDFPGLLVGVRYQGDTFRSYMSPGSEYNERQRIRSVFQKIKKEYKRTIQNWNEKEYLKRLRELREARHLQRKRKKHYISKKKRFTQKKRIAKKKRVIKKKRSSSRKHK